MKLRDCAYCIEIKPIKMGISDSKLQYRCPNCGLTAPWSHSIMDIIEKNRSIIAANNWNRMVKDILYGANTPDEVLYED